MEAITTYLWIHCQLKKDELLPFSEDAQRVCKFCEKSSLILQLSLCYDNIISLANFKLGW